MSTPQNPQNPYDPWAPVVRRVVNITTGKTTVMPTIPYGQGQDNRLNLPGGYPQPTAEKEIGARDTVAQLEADLVSCARGLPGDLRSQLTETVFRHVDDILARIDPRALRGILGTYPHDPRLADGAGVAAQLLADRRASVASDYAAGAAAWTALKPKVLAAMGPAQPIGTDDSDVADRKADLVAILQGAPNPTAMAQQLLHDAIVANDGLTLYCLIGGPLNFAAQAVKVNLDTVRSVYADVKVADEGPYPLMGGTPGAALVVRLGDVQTLLDTARDAANASLDDAEAQLKAGQSR